MENFKEGDVVQLKSGGPKMTVKTMHTDGDVYCQWFSGSKLQDGYFKPHSLQKGEETDE
jgi:uncharacterized protein YodC (DUF2158 family)